MVLLSEKQIKDLEKAIINAMKVSKELMDGEISISVTTSKIQYEEFIEKLKEKLDKK